jgi:flagellar basal-body rod protein FlgB
MQPIHLLDLASRKTAWLAARQAAVAGNIANANTPGYKAKDVAPFQDVLAQTRLDMVATNAAHLSVSGNTSAQSVSEQEDEFEVTESGNSVGLEQEMARGGEVNREYALTTNLVKSFHSMLMSALKG